MRTSKIKFLLTCAASLLLLTACGGSDDDQQTEATTYQVAVEKSFVLNSNTNKRTLLNTTGVSSASSLSAELSIDPTSTVTRVGDDSSARVETDVQLAYRDASDTTSFYAGSRIAYNGSAINPVGWIGKCIDEGACTFIDFVIDETLDVPLGDTINISVSWDEPNQKFIHTYGSVTRDSHLADLQAEIPAAEGFNFTDYSYDKSLIGTSVRNIERSGDSGSIKVNFDNVSHDGVVYDDFDSETLDETKWTLETRDYGEQPQLETYDSTITVNKTFTTVEEDDKTTYLVPREVSNATNISADLSIEPTSTLTRVGDSSSAHLQTGVSLIYQNTNDNSSFYVQTRIRYYSDSDLSANGKLMKCIDGGDCFELGFYGLPFSISTGDTANIAITWNETDQTFTHTYGTASHVSHLSEFVALQEIIDSGGFVFSDYSFQKSEVRVEALNIKQVGESGTIKVKLHKVSHDSVVYDDFSSDTFDSTKWSVETRER